MIKILSPKIVEYLDSSKAQAMASSVTLTSATLEGQILEMVLNVQAYQNNTATNPNSRQVITAPLIMNAGTGLATVSLQIPIAAGKDTDGSVDSTAVEVFVNP